MLAVQHDDDDIYIYIYIYNFRAVQIEENKYIHSVSQLLKQNDWTQIKDNK